ncbi:Ldh family oxidoreductase [Longimicrobium sp.]|uniref:Ldh family oxidoreductase n=1 Tax=Longimicrobium sp. TaxID=2029185 RepID=UPI002BCE7DA1|nr:Ldh family oxidoreductase [Longimicrobium sp.]HSU17564.1 Ldh family oxidoreductase [Longimicrobium sp.]
MTDTPATAAETFPIERLREFSTRVFAACGVPEEDAALAAGVLASADLRGIDTHGVARLPQYHEMFEQGRINPRPNIHAVRESPATATVDGDNGLGLVVGPRANEMAMEKAERVGTGWVAVRNSNHFGAGEYYPLQGLPRGLIVWAMTNSPPQVAPLWGAEKMLGTNPISIAFPGMEEPAVVIDFTTSAIAFGKVEHAARKGATIPAGTAIDRDGRMTTDPREMLDGGALLPLGGDAEHGGHKGYCLAAMVDLLAAALPGANWGPFPPPFPAHLPEPPRSVGLGVGHMFGAFRIDAFADPAEFRRQVDDWVRTMRSTRPAAGTTGPIIPGDPNRRAEETRREHGVPVIRPVVEALERVAAATGVPFR